MKEEVNEFPGPIEPLNCLNLIRLTEKTTGIENEYIDRANQVGKTYFSGIAQ